MPSPCCSSCRSACCSIRRSWSAIRLPVLATLLIIIVGKSVVAFCMVRLFRHPTSTALTISASLAQIGEFSFILAGLGVALGAAAAERARPDPGRRDALDHAEAVPVRRARLVHAQHEAGEREPPPPTRPPRRSLPRRHPRAGPATLLTDHVVLVGYGRVGSVVGAALIAADVPLLVSRATRTSSTALRKQGIETIGRQRGRSGAGVAANTRRRAACWSPFPTASRAVRWSSRRE